MIVCKKCEREHAEEKVCVCGACLYQTANQVPDDMYPIFVCRDCGRTVFWD
jgi:hypothetical protein